MTADELRSMMVEAAKEELDDALNNARVDGTLVIVKGMATVFVCGFFSAAKCFGFATEDDLDVLHLAIAEVRKWMHREFFRAEGEGK